MPLLKRNKGAAPLAANSKTIADAVEAIIGAQPQGSRNPRRRRAARAGRVPLLPVVVAENLTLDHVVPVARGGRSTRGNCVPRCQDCNAKKKAYTPAEQILAKLFPDSP